MAGLSKLRMDEVVEEALAGLGPVPFGHAMRAQFEFAEGWVNLNHGSFGAPAKPVRQIQQRFQRLAETAPDIFTRHTYPSLLSASRAALAPLLNVPASELAFVANATTGVNTVLRGLTFAPGDQILYFDFIYGACGNTVLYVAETTAAEAVRVEVRLPVADDDALVRVFEDTVRSAGGVKIAVLDTVVSLPGMRLPFEKLVRKAKELGVLTLLDAAHGVGHLPLDLGTLDADFAVSNCHKWLFTPRGCAVLHVPARNHRLIRSTLPTSWSFRPLPLPGHVLTTNPLPKTTAASPFVETFDFVGTVDGSPFLCIPGAIRFRQLVCGGEDAIAAYCRDIAERGADIVASRLARLGRAEVMPQPAGRCCLVNVRLPLEVGELRGSVSGKGEGEGEGEKEGEEREEEVWKMVTSFITNAMEEFNTYIPVVAYKGAWWARLSGQIYLEESDFVKGAEVLAELVQRVKNGEFRRGKKDLAN